MRKKTAVLTIASALAITIAAPAAIAGKADVVDARIESTGDGTWRVEATVRHADAGWDHYADAWEVTGPDGNVLGTRELHHPHENEQPFTRSLGGLRIPESIDRIGIRARDSVHGFGGETVQLDVPR